MDFDGTRSLFSGLIDKPPLTDKLLSRPPFKFLLDVFSNSINKTGYLKDQFPSSSFNEGSLGDKDSKVAFLEKLITILNTDGSLNDVKASKIVAGKEPELTIKLLKKFANEARQFRDGSAASNKENKKKSSSSSSTKEKDSKKEHRDLSKGPSKSTDKSKDPEKRSKSKDKKSEEKESKHKSSKDRESKSKDRDSDKKKEKDKDREKSRERSSSKKDKEKSSKSTTEKKEKSSKTKVSEETPLDRRRTSILPAPTEPSPSFGQTEIDHHLDSHDDEASGTVKTEDSGFAESDRVISPRPPPPEVREHTRIGTSMGRPQTSMGRPGTAAARSAPPKLKKKQIAEVELKQPTIIEPKVEILTETTSTQPEEDFLIEEQEEVRPDVIKEEFDPNAEHGGLVAKIMETREQLDDGQTHHDHDDIDDGEMARQRHQVENVQKNLQRVTQTAFPLAKIFDFAQEDLDSMMKELEKWRNETRKNEQELKEREAQGHGDAHKYSVQLSQLEDSIRETRQQLQNVKGKLSTNEEQMRVMLANM